MKELSKFNIDQWYYIKDNVIFNISSESNGDICAKHSEDIKSNIPSIVVKDTSITTAGYTGDTLYLDVYIEDGDKYVSSTFKKVIHSDDTTTAETDKTFQEYYESLCDDEIKKNVLLYFDKDYTWLNKNIGVLGVPLYVFEGKGYKVTGITQINFTSEYLSDLKDEIALEEVTKAAKGKADNLGYSVTSEITIEEKE